MALTPIGRGLTLDAFFGGRLPPDTLAFAASTTDPAIAVTEPAGADYARATLANTDAAGAFTDTNAEGRKFNAIPIEWPTAASSWGTIGWLAVYAGEELLGFAALAVPRTIGPGQKLTIPAGALVLTIGSLGTETLTGTGTIEASALAIGSGSAVDPSADPLAIIPADRQTTWNPGIPGGIPTTRNSVPINGLTLDGTGDTNAATINTAIGQAGDRYVSTGVIQEVVLPAGTIRTTGAITINRSGVVLRGQGNTTRIRFDGTPGDNVGALRIQRQTYPSWAAGTGPWYLAADGAKGDTQIVLANASASNIQVGDVLCVDVEDHAGIWLNGGTWGRRQTSTDTNGPALPNTTWRSVSTLVGITSKTVGATNTTLGLAEPLHMPFPMARGAQAWHCASKYTSTRTFCEGTHYSGIENLYVTGAGVWVQRAAYCWVRGVEVDGNPGTANIGTYTNPGGTGDISLRIQQSYRCDFRECYIHHKRSIAQGGAGYLVDFKMYTSETLLEDNIITNGNKVVIATNCGGGNVIGYNYCDGAKTSPDGGWQEGCIDVCHLAYSHSLLIEGNHSTNLVTDTVWGNSGFHLFFRNYGTGANTLLEYGSAPYSTAPDDGYMRAAGPDGGTDETTYIGNVLVSPVALYEAASNSPAAVWRIGQGSPLGNDGGHALSLLYRHRNWDSANGAVVDTDPTNTHPLPASVYLAAKPAFFGALPWPWVNPDGATPGERVGTLPAKARFDAM